ncbi:MAG: GLUG motif-containing protein, partial [Planctomycetota bacterium]
MRSAVDLLNGIKVVLAMAAVCALAGPAFGDYCGASGYDYYYEYIRGVEVWTISNATGWSSYTDYTHLSTELYIGFGYLITVTNGGPYSGDQCGVWVDWNSDEDFEDVNEMIVMTGGPETFTGTITPPEGAAEGATRMRVRITDTVALSPCGTTDYGEVEDYTLIVTEFVSPGYGGGSGTAADPYLIYTAEQMNMIGVGYLDWGKHFRLMADIDLSAYTGTSFNIIGSEAVAFTGVFDGGGHTISNFTYDSNGAGHVGLFGYIDDVNAEVRDLGMIEPNISGTVAGSIAGVLFKGSMTNCYAEGGSISGNWHVGGLVGYGRDNRISDCHSTSNVRGRKYWVGGLVGYNSGGNIFNCYSTGEVIGASEVGGLVGTAYYNNIEECHSTSNVTGGSNVGGLVGDSWDSNILNCHSSGDVAGGHLIGGLVGDDHYGYISGCYSSSTVTGNLYVGGLVGVNNAGNTTFNCYSTGSVTGGDAVGGLVGHSEYGGTIINCYSTAGVDGNDRVGGLVGCNFIGSSIVDCYSTGSVTGQQQVGGLAGRNYDIISNCYASGTVTGDYYVGGLVGRGGNSDHSAETYHCYSVGSVDGNDFVGGLVGDTYHSDIYTACFWDSDVNPALSGIGNRSDPAV